MYKLQRDLAHQDNNQLAMYYACKCFFKLKKNHNI